VIASKGSTTNSADEKENPSLHASLRDGMSHAVMLGSGETYLGPFGIFLQATTLQIGLLATLPQLFGAAMQWLGALSVERSKSRRKVIVTGVVAQALVWTGIAAVPLLFGAGVGPVFALIGMAVLYHGAAGFVAPVWNSLIGDLVPDAIRGRFFGRRNQLNGMGTFAALILAGGILELFQRLGRATTGFLIVFGIAFVARLNSARWLSRYEDPPSAIADGQRFSFWQFLRRTPYSNFARFVWFVSTINFAVAFSGPYFALYMLRDLQFSYLEFTSVTAVSAIAQFLTFRYWGGLSDRFGNKRILDVCGWAIATVPLLWLFSAKLGYLLIIQSYGGFVWAGFSLAAGNFMFDAVTPAKRARCAAYQAMINGVFVVCGSLAGGFVATRLPAVFHIGNFIWVPASGLLVLFLISGVMRLVTSAILLRRFGEVRNVEAIRRRELIFRISHLRPIAGATFSVLTGRFGERETPQSTKSEARTEEY
jgi:MFS family permease